MKKRDSSLIDVENILLAKPDQEKPLLSIVLAAYNEARAIEDVVKGYFDEVVTKLPRSRLVVAEDGSTDQTPQILASLASSFPFIYSLIAREKVSPKLLEMPSKSVTRIGFFSQIPMDNTSHLTFGTYGKIDMEKTSS